MADDFGEAPGVWIEAGQVHELAGIFAEELERAGEALSVLGQQHLARRRQRAGGARGGVSAEQRAEAAAGCVDLSFELAGYGTVRVVCGQAGRRDVWHNVFAAGTRFGFNGGRWARGQKPADAVLAAIRERGVSVFG